MSPHEGTMRAGIYYAHRCAGSAFYIAFSTQRSYMVPT